MSEPEYWPRVAISGVAPPLRPLARSLLQVREFVPRGEMRQPAWATELMRACWAAPR